MCDTLYLNVQNAILLKMKKKKTQKLYDVEHIRSIGKNGQEENVSKIKNIHGIYALKWCLRKICKYTCIIFMHFSSSENRINILQKLLKFN